MQVQLGKYTLVELLGRGGMGEVWKARASGPNDFSRTVVIKRLLPNLSREPQFLKMFAAEARLSALLHHGNIVQVFELCEIEDETVLVMEFVDGRNLGVVLTARRGQPIPAAAAAYIAREIAQGLAYAHALRDERGVPLGIIHRDVTPSNVMLGRHGAVKLLDFGIAKALPQLGGIRTATGVLKGKLCYMSPEQVPGDLQRKDIDHRVDQYALGVLLHEMLTGRRLFRAASDALVMQLMAKDAPPPSAVNAAVPPALEHICLRALSRQRERRFPSCAEMAAALDELLATLPFSATRMSRLLREVDDATAESRQAHTQAGQTQLVTGRGSSLLIWLGAAVILLVVASVSLGIRIGVGTAPPRKVVVLPTAYPEPAPARASPPPLPLEAPPPLEPEPAPAATATPPPARPPAAHAHAHHPGRKKAGKPAAPPSQSVHAGAILDPFE